MNHTNNAVLVYYYFTKITCDGVCGCEKWKTNYFALQHLAFTDTSIFTARKRSLGQGNIFAPVCHSVHRGREYLGRYPPWAGTHPPGQVHTPLGRYTPMQVHPPGQVHPRQVPPGRYTPQAGTPPGRYTPLGSNACWEIQAISGQYASYWNAFLFTCSTTIKFDMYFKQFVNKCKTFTLKV